MKFQLMLPISVAAFCLLPAFSQKAPVDYVDPTIGNVVPYLVPNRPNVHQPNQMLRTYPFVGDYLEDQIAYFPLLVMHARGKGILQMRVAPGDIAEATWKRPMTIDHDLQITKPWFYEAYLLDDDTTVNFA
ncbi:MAG TPA: hypothetical protein VLA12_02685, partial [Planctomycetaceae bacterium]|nr:hypothetical protein [Planctomycetaceae bacterium]